VPTTVTLTGPPGLVVEDAILPPSEPLHLSSMGIELPVWSGTVDIVVPFYPVGELASEVRPLDAKTATLEVDVRYQACDNDVCFLPRTEKLSLELSFDVIDVPALGMHSGHGQREATWSGRRHLRRLALRKILPHPLGFLRFIAKSIKLELAARVRARGHEVAESRTPRRD
jgi:hypothetical protein